MGFRVLSRRVCSSLDRDPYRLPTILYTPRSSRDGHASSSDECKEGRIIGSIRQAGVFVHLRALDIDSIIR